MAIPKSLGTTASEQLLAKLCEHTFLGFWSYANTFRGNHIILFSDKSCAFPDTGNLKLDWSRWFRKSVSDSARQVLGAERWLKQHPDRVYLDKNCTLRLPIALDHAAKCAFHRIVVASGAKDRCQRHRAGSGSLILEPAVVGNAHFDLANYDVQPFVVGSIDADPGRLHVFDEYTLPLVLKELDTIADFLSYLEFKEVLFRSNKIGTIAGEENLLATFLSDFHRTGSWRRLLDDAKDGAVINITSGGWDLFVATSWYKETREFFQHSYIWDRIIQEFASHAFGGTLIQDSSQTVAANEEIFRNMAREPRIARVFLTAKMVERWSQFEENRVTYRIVESPTLTDTLYVFVFVPNSFASTTEYRQVRQEHLQEYCFLVHSKHRAYRRVVGIASDAADERFRTFDALLVEGEQWTPAMESMAAEIQADLGISGEGPIHRIGEVIQVGPAKKPAGQSQQRVRHRDDGKIGRNDRCPCGSGKKFKHCCLPRSR